MAPLDGSGQAPPDVELDYSDICVAKMPPEMVDELMTRGRPVPCPAVRRIALETTALTAPEHPNAAQIRKLDYLTAFFRDGSNWTKQHLRMGHQRCLVGAILEIGASELTDVILGVAQAYHQHPYPRLEQFNDSRRTNHGTLMKVLELTRTKLLHETFDWNAAVAAGMVMHPPEVYITAAQKPASLQRLYKSVATWWKPGWF